MTSSPNASGAVEPVLTIAIPTYNRNATLARNLALLLPQLTPGCTLLLLDNASDVPVEETLRPLLEAFPAVKCEVARNRVNIGANANIMRCLERCETPWLWLLGDDDPVQPDAIATIVAALEAHSGCVLLNFSSDGRRASAFETRGLAQLTRKLDAAADLPWISNSIYNVEAMLPHLKLGYHYTYSLLPHVVTLLAAVGQNGSCRFLTETVVDACTRREASSPDEAWSLIPLALGFPIVGDLPLEPQVRRRLLDKLLLTQRGDGLNMRFLLYQLLLLATRGGDPHSALYIYDQTCARRFYFDKSFKSRLQRFGGHLLLRFPGVAAGVYRLLKRQEFGGQGQTLQDRYGRL